MGARPLTDLGVAMLDSLPPKVRNSIDYQAVIHAASREVALLEASIETVRAQFNPASADVLLDAWEAMLKLPVGGPAGADTATRRSLVLARLQKIVTAGEGSQWEQAITDIVGPGWSYIEHYTDGGPLQNHAPNPNFDHDTLGATPAAWTFNSFATTAVSNAWADTGGQSAHLVTAAVGTGASGFARPTGPTTGPGSAGAGVWAVAGAIPVALRASVNTSALGGGAFTYQWVVLPYDASGAALGSRVGPSPAAAAGAIIDLETVVTLTADAAYVAVLLEWACQSPGTLDFFLDSVGVFLNSPGGVVPPYGDGDQPGWQWVGTAGNSASQPVSPPDGEITITLPFAPGASQFIEATNQIRDITDAHLVLNFASSAVFRTDSDPMDSTEFGA